MKFLKEKSPEMGALCRRALISFIKKTLTHVEAVKRSLVKSPQHIKEVL